MPPLSLVILLVYLALGLGAHDVAAEAIAPPSPRDIMDKNFHASKIAFMTNDSTMTLNNDKGQQRVRKTHSVSLLQPNGIDSKIMIRFLFPGDVEGTGYLQVQHYDGQDDMWIYLPALKKVRRLVADEKKNSFVGSDFSYGDILIPVVDTYTYTLVKTDMLDGEDCWVIEAVPATEQIKKDYGYAKKIAWIRKSNFMEKKIEFFDTSGRPLKTMIVPEVKEIDTAHHKWWALRRDIANIQTGHRTSITFENLDTTKPVGDEFFTPRYLERER
jgi:hypothetical protein